MAEISSTTANKQKGKIQLVKKSTRVDLTPMVDLGFLLITFFVFTTALSKPKAMDIRTPADAAPGDMVCASCVLTIIPGENNRISYYEGMPESNPLIKEVSFEEEGLRKLLLDKRERVRIAKGDAQAMVLIIKPTEGCAYKNFVDILDETSINDIRHYYIDELNDADKKLMARN